MQVLRRELGIRLIARTISIAMIRSSLTPSSGSSPADQVRR